MKPTLTPISYTALVKSEACPLHWYATYRLKLGDTGTTKTFKGSKEHEQIEREINAFIASPSDATLPQGLPGELLKRLRPLGGKFAAEAWLAVKRDGTYSPYGDTPYIRCKVDFIHTSADKQVMRIIDWKTGDWVPRSDLDIDLTQLRMNAVAAFGKARVQKVIPLLAYTAKDKLYPTIPLVIKREDVAPETRSAEFVRLYQRFAKFEELQSRTEITDFPAIPCRHCAYCTMVTCEHHPSQ